MDNEWIKKSFASCELVFTEGAGGEDELATICAMRKIETVGNPLPQSNILVFVTPVGMGRGSFCAIKYEQRRQRIACVPNDNHTK